MIIMLDGDFEETESEMPDKKATGQKSDYLKEKQSDNSDKNEKSEENSQENSEFQSKNLVGLRKFGFIF